MKSIGYLRDVTDQKRYEQELRMFKFCVDQAPEAICWADEKASFTYVNEYACQMLGYRQDELLQMSVKDVQPDLRKEDWEARWQQYENTDLVGSGKDERLNLHESSMIQLRL